MDRAVAALPRVNGTGPEHYRALPDKEVRTALRAIRRLGDAPSAAALCVELIVLTAVRGGEARGARWDEIDLESARWTIPALRMKAGREFTVPLSTGALDVLERARALSRRVGAGVSVEVGRAAGRERAGARASGCRGGLDAARVPVERAVVDGRIGRPGGGRGSLPRPRPEKPGCSGVSAIRPAGAPRRSPSGVVRIHQ